jgi:phosphoribosylformimino-5-aminoimidazole carboxamide ribotide isomerase
MNRWQTLTNLKVNESTLNSLADHCDEFLIHAADVEGKCQGIDCDLVEKLGKWVTIPTTYAGGVANIKDVELVASLSGENVDVTVGSALDLFGGDGINYKALVRWNQEPTA